MAISKERLEELIEREAKVYDPDYMWGSVGELILNKDMKVVDWRLKGELKSLKVEGGSCLCSVPLEDLVETKEEAEWKLEFGNIQRTETLSLPTWKEFQKHCDFFRFTDKYGNKCTIEKYGNYGNKFIDVVQNGVGIIFPYLSYNENDYIKACRLAKKLFLGEETQNDWQKS